MNMAKRIIALILCVAFCSIFSITVFAEDAPPKITLTNASLMPEDTVKIDISIENNPGIMAMTFAIVYEKDAFEYVSYNNGWLTGITIKDHPDKGYVLLAYVATANKTNNGNMLSVNFKVKQKAAPGNHKITLGNNNYERFAYSLHNSFSNSDLEFVVPQVSGGTITVGETCINAGHKWGEWNISRPANCTQTGLKDHTCARCTLNEEIDIPITHDFEAEWTVDESATPEKDGVMSRHCTKCDAVTDKINYSYEEVGGNDTTTSVPDNSSTTTDPTSSDTVSGDTPTQRPPINNNVGDKNPLESVENLKDYIDNIKPGIDNPEEPTSPDATESTDSTTSSPSSTPAPSQSKSASSDNQKAFSILKTPLGLVLITVGTAVGCSLIALGITLLVLKLKKKNK